MSTITSDYSLPTGHAVDDLLPSTEVNAIGALEAAIFQVLAEVLGPGVRTAADWNGSAGAGLSVDISAGRGIIGDTGNRKFVRTAATINLPGLTATRDNYVYKNQTAGGTSADFQFTAVTVGAAPPATPSNTHPVLMATTDGSGVTAVNNLPPGRFNLPNLAAFGDAATEASATTTDATVTTLLSYTPPDLSVTKVRVEVVARKSDGTAGAGYTITATFRRSGATVTQVGATTILATHEDNASYDATVNTDGTVIRVRVTGVAATTLSWRAKASLVQVN